MIAEHKATYDAKEPRDLIDLFIKMKKEGGKDKFSGKK